MSSATHPPIGAPTLSHSAAEKRLADFYGRYPYPWRPFQLETYADPAFDIRLINQELGDWTHSTVPTHPKVWVAGCGTVQALMTALRMPGASVVGSDLSEAALSISESIATELGIGNLELRHESLNDVDYDEEFDYVISTGVIHHNPDPAVPLRAISNAVRRDGIVELMVYNRFHRQEIEALQTAVRLLNAEGGVPDDLRVAETVATSLPHDNQLVDALDGSREYLKDQGDEAFADAWINPLEHSYTVESLAALAGACGLRLHAPCVAPLDRLSDSWDWELRFDDDWLQSRFDALPRLERWQVSNMLQFDRSPLLWFYLQRQDCDRAIPTERDKRESFLERTFAPASTRIQRYLLEDDDRYVSLDVDLRHPSTNPVDETLERILLACDGATPMRSVLAEVGEEPSAYELNRIRVGLTTPQFPYLVAVG